MVTIFNALAYIGIYISLFTSIFFFYTFLENRKSDKRIEWQELPTVTICIPAWNAEKGLAKTAESLLSMDYPREKLQIMIVENSGSTDKTLEIAKTFEPQGVEVYSTPEKGKGSALNFALGKARGEFFGALDADSVAEPNILKNLLSYFSADDIVAVTPTLKVQNPSTFLHRIQQIEYLTGVFLRKVFDYLDSIHVTPGPLTIYRKSFFEKFGPYDNHNLTEDLEVALRIQANDLRIKNAMDANVYTASPPSFFVLMRQRIRWYLGFLENLSRYPQLFGPRFGILAAFILPMALTSVVLAVLFSSYALYKIAISALGYDLILTAINFDIVTAIKSWTFNFFNILPGFKSLIGLLLLVAGFLMVYFAKKRSKDTSRIGFFYLAYFIFYIYLFSFWWIMAVLHKLFAPEFRWGGYVWTNSLLNQLLGKVNNRE